MTAFTATRAHGLEALERLSGGNGTDYLRRREFDLVAEDRGPVTAHYLRHRLLTDDEAALSVQRTFASGPRHAFLEDLCENAFARGCLARRPGLVRRYISDVVSIESELDRQSELRRRLAHAAQGKTGLACFDAWAHEIAAGYLHKRSRRAFASIWVFTLELPWQSGVRLFMQHLLEADLADTLLLWREVAGLENDPPFYVTTDDIAALTAQRFARTSGLAKPADVLAPEQPLETLLPMAASVRADAGPAVLLVTCDDLHPESWPIEDVDVRGVLAIEPPDLFGWYSDSVLAFKLAGLDDALRRASTHFDCPVERLRRGDDAKAKSWAGQGNRELRDWFVDLKADRLIAMSPAAGPAQDDIAMACRYLSHPVDPPQLQLIRRAWDVALEAIADQDRTAFVSKIPQVLAQLGIR